MRERFALSDCYWRAHFRPNASVCMYVSGPVKCRSADLEHCISSPWRDGQTYVLAWTDRRASLFHVTLQVFKQFTIRENIKYFLKFYGLVWKWFSQSILIIRPIHVREKLQCFIICFRFLYFISSRFFCDYLKNYIRSKERLAGGRTDWLNFVRLSL